MSSGLPCLDAGGDVAKLGIEAVMTCGLRVIMTTYSGGKVRVRESEVGILMIAVGDMTT